VRDEPLASHWGPRAAFHALAWIFMAGIIAQVYIAGLAVFADPSRWAWHRGLAVWVAAVPLLMLPLAFVARLPARTRWLTVLAFALLNVQGATARIGGLAGAVHPVTALLLFWTALALLRPTPGVIGE
jgi:hypothetical protein